MNKDNLEVGLYIVSTPIGNLDDISFRAKNILSMVDIVICENPIHSLKLLNKLGIKKKLFSLHDYNEEILIKRLEKYQNNSAIALISDAGSPLISDPGYNLVLNYIKKGLMITTIPGASSVISALQLSGVPINKFIFHGFVSKNKKEGERLLKEVSLSNTTSVVFISGLRLLGVWGELVKLKMHRNMSVSKEITKKNERVFRGGVSEIIDELSNDNKMLKGEFVLVIEGAKKKVDYFIEDNIKNIIKKLLKKFSLTEVVEIVHNLTKISKKNIYKESLLIKNE